MATTNTPLVWVTADDLKKALNTPGPWTQDENAWIDVVVSAVDRYIKRVRSDLTPPASVTISTGQVFTTYAFSQAFGPAFQASSPPGGGSGADACWAAVQLAMHWYFIKGNSQPNTYEEFGTMPTFLAPRFVEEALELGRSHRPVVA